MKIIHWIGIDDHADKWTIAHLRGNEDKPAREFELVTGSERDRKLIKHANQRDGEGSSWTNRFWTWLNKIKLEGEHSQLVLDELILAHGHRLEQRGRYDDAIEVAAKTPQYAPFVAALTVLRGIDRLSAMTILSELGDLRRFATAPQVMAAIGLVPGEATTAADTHRLPFPKQSD